MLSLIITVNNLNEEKFNNLNESLIDDIIPENNEFKTSFNCCCYALYKNFLSKQNVVKPNSVASEYKV